MLFEQHHSQDLLTPAINDGGVHKLNSSLTSLDFYLLDDIDAYLPSLQSKTNKNDDLINDSLINNSQHHDDLLANFDFSDFDEESDFVNSIPIDELELEKWISQSAFPSPPMDSNTLSPLSTIDDTSSIFSEYLTNADMVVPPSPSLSSTSSSSTPSTKKTKLSVVERKLRKKTQNKTAAEKYRIRKKYERHHLGDRHMQLKTTNTELKLELENLTFRLEKFKQLFVDLLHIDLPIVN